MHPTPCREELSADSLPRHQHPGFSVQLQECPKSSGMIRMAVRKEDIINPGKIQVQLFCMADEKIGCTRVKQDFQGPGLKQDRQAMFHPESFRIQRPVVRKNGYRLH